MKIHPIIRNTTIVLALIALDISIVESKPRLFPAQRPHHNHAPSLPPLPSGQFGDTLPGLTDVEAADFTVGKEEFENVETPEGGLGPVFNNKSCASCHTDPVIGGASGKFVTRFGRTENTIFVSLETEGGSLLQQNAISIAAKEEVPTATWCQTHPQLATCKVANVIVKRITTPLFGLGLIEAIPDETIRANATQSKPDGVRGHVSIVMDATSGPETVERVGRFGWKAQQATLLAFAGDAYLNEMGITNRLFPNENAPNGNIDLLAEFDTVIDPEDTVDTLTGKGDIDTAADFMRYLGVPPRIKITNSAIAGENIFNQAGCAACHKPSMQTGFSPVAALNRKTVSLYSDLLVHDMGSLGDGIKQGNADIREMRTAPLWGLRARPVYLHDGRTKSIDAAIRAHDGEAKTSQIKYTKLTPQKTQQLLDFLNSL
jgi:CxxC motif-containing protein (DUF1111 family)